MFFKFHEMWKIEQLLTDKEGGEALGVVCLRAQRTQ